MCYLLHTIHAYIGLGPVTFLKAEADEDGINVSWSPPNISGNTILNYNLTYSDGGMLVSAEITQNLSLRIPAMQGDVYTVMVVALTDTGPGESSTIMARVECKSHSRIVLYFLYYCCYYLIHR